MDNIEKEKRVKQLMISGLTRSEALIYYYKENPKPLYDRIPNTSLERLRLIEIKIYMDRYEMSEKEASDHWDEKKDHWDEKRKKRQQELIDEGISESEAKETEMMELWGFTPEQQKKMKTKSNSGCMLVLIILITPIILISLLTYNN